MRCSSIFEEIKVDIVGKNLRIRAKNEPSCDAEHRNQTTLMRGEHSHRRVISALVTPEHSFSFQHFAISHC